MQEMKLCPTKLPSSGYYTVQKSRCSILIFDVIREIVLKILAFHENTIIFYLVKAIYIKTRLDKIHKLYIIHSKYKVTCVCMSGLDASEVLHRRHWNHFIKICITLYLLF